MEKQHYPYLPETLVDCDYVFDLSDEGEQAEAWHYVKSTGMSSRTRHGERAQKGDALANFIIFTRATAPPSTTGC